MDAPLHRLRSERPFRPLDWRWQLAVQLHAGDLPPRCRDWADAPVVRAARFLAGRPDPVLAQALAVRDGPALDRSELEARLLAGQPEAAIATAVGLPRAVVRLSAALFVHVCDRLAARGWLLHHAVGETAFTGLEPGDTDGALKLAAVRLPGESFAVVVRYHRAGLDRVADRDAAAVPDAGERADLRAMRAWLWSPGPAAPDTDLRMWAARQPRAAAVPGVVAALAPPGSRAAAVLDLLSEPAGSRPAVEAVQAP
jgi:hypothetical protein